jgi:hypothetical protein
MQLLRRRQMVLGMEANVSQFCRYPKFSMLPQPVREEECAISNQVLSVAYLP